MVRNQTINGRRAPRVVALVAATFASLALVVTLAPLAGAQTPDPGSPGGHPQLTDAQKACLTQHGVQPPARPAAGQQPTPPTDQQRQAFEAAAKACGLPAHPHVQLTAAQRTCLTQQGVTPPAPGSAKPTSPPSAEQRAKIEAAAKACGLPAPPKAPGSNS